MSRNISEAYYQAKSILTSQQVISGHRVTEKGKKMIDHFFPSILGEHSSLYIKRSMSVLPKDHSLDDLVYTLALLLWSEQTNPERQRIREWTAKYNLHPALVPITGAIYCVEQSINAGLLKIKPTNGLALEQVTYAESTTGYATR